MKELLIKVQIDNDSGKIATAIKHRGFSDEGYSVEQILLTMGILDNIKASMQAKLDQKLNVSGDTE